MLMMMNSMGVSQSDPMANLLPMMMLLGDDDDSNDPTATTTDDDNTDRLMLMMLMNPGTILLRLYFIL